MSPATDYAAMLMALYAITRWFVLAEKIRLLKNDGSEHDELIKHESVYEYALLCVLMVFILTVKISAGVMVLVVLYPLVILINRKDIKSIVVFLLLGIITLFPYLLRNYYVSGWLIYPFEGIDIFNPDWKVPLETLQRDAALIKTYGRGLCDAELIDTPFKEWFSVWKNSLQTYERNLMIGFVIASVGVLLRDIERIITKNVVWAFIIMHIAVWLSVLMWFMEAPFIRYGLCFILAMPCILIGEYLSMRKRGLGHVIRAIYIITTFMFCLEFINNYFEDFGVFVKQNITEPYYIVQKDYDSTPTNSQKVGDFELNYPIDGELNSYYAYPGTAYQGRLDEIEARGDTIRDGFRHKSS